MKTHVKISLALVGLLFCSELRADLWSELTQEAAKERTRRAREETQKFREEAARIRTETETVRNQLRDLGSKYHFSRSQIIAAVHGAEERVSGPYKNLKSAREAQEARLAFLGGLIVSVEKLGHNLQHIIISGKSIEDLAQELLLLGDQLKASSSTVELWKEAVGVIAAGLPAEKRSAFEKVLQDTESPLNLPLIRSPSFDGSVARISAIVSNPDMSNLLNLIMQLSSILKTEYALIQSQKEQLLRTESKLAKVHSLLVQAGEGLNKQQ